MLKTIALLKKKPGLSKADFIAYYETRHSVLIRQLLPGIVGYRRNFLDLEGAFVFPGAQPLDFDVVTELWFESAEAYAAAMARAAEPDIARQIAQDEENLFDRAATRMFVVEERGAPPEH
jgi:uncharacterized protein (TIGR02118 family)